MVPPCVMSHVSSSNGVQNAIKQGPYLSKSWDTSIFQCSEQSWTQKKWMLELAKNEFQPGFESPANLCCTAYAFSPGRASDFLVSACLRCSGEDSLVPSFSDGDGHWSRAVAPGMTAAACLGGELTTR